MAKFRWRHGTSAARTTVTSTSVAGMLYVEEDTGSVFVGDGVTTVAALLAANRGNYIPKPVGGHPGFVMTVQSDGTVLEQAPADVTAYVQTAVDAYLASTPTANTVVVPSYLQTSGVNQSYAQTPDSAGLKITGDLDIRWYGSFGTLNTGGLQTIAAKQTSAKISWIWKENTNGRFTFQVSDGTATPIASANANTPAGSAYRVTWRASDGQVAFFCAFPQQRSITDLVTVTTITPRIANSASANFTSADLGAPITGSNLAAGTTITAINSATQIQLSQNASGAGTAAATIGFKATDGTKWTLIGGYMAASLSGAPLYTATATPLTLGAVGNGTGVISAGSTFQSFSVRAGIDTGSVDGAIKASPDFSNFTAAATSYTDAQTNVWSISGTDRIIPISGSATRNGKTLNIASVDLLRSTAGGYAWQKRNAVTGCFDVDDFGPAGIDPASWTVAQTGAAVRAARDAAALTVDLANGRGATVYFGARTYEVDADTSLADPVTGLNYCAIKTYDYVTFKGAGKDATTIKLTSGANCHVFGHPGRLQASGQQDQIVNVSWQDLTIDGNKSGQNGTHTHDGLRISQHPGLQILNVRITNCDGKGYYSTANGDFSVHTTTSGSTVWTTNTAPTSIVAVSTTGFSASGGTLNVYDGAANPRVVKYTGISGNTFTGVTLAASPPIAVAGTVAAGSTVVLDPGANIVKPINITDSEASFNAQWGWFMSATNRHTTYKGLRAVSNGSPRADLVGKKAAVNLTNAGTISFLVDQHAQVDVTTLTTGDTAAQVATKINTALSSVTKSMSVTFNATYTPTNFPNLSVPAVVFSSAHALGIGTPVVFSSVTGASGLVAGTTYYVRDVYSPTAVTLTASPSGFTSLFSFTSNGTGTAAWGTPNASVTTSGRLIVSSGTWGGCSKVFLVNTSNTQTLADLGLTLNPLNGDNNYRVGSNEFGGFILDHSECMAAGLVADSNFGDGIYIHNVNATHYQGFHATRNSGHGIYVDAWDHSTGMQWVSMMNCADFGVATYRVGAFGSTTTAELYFDNGVEGYGVTQDTTLIGFNGPGDKITIGASNDNRYAAYSIVIAHGVAANGSFDIVYPKYGDGGLTGTLLDQR